jgi:hypothetical protein
MISDSTSTTGQCLCGAVRYVVEGALGDVRYCHCRMCRRATGSAFSANARIPTERFTLLEGTDVINQYEASPGAFRCFCGRCGSPVFAKVASDPGYIRIRLGTLAQPHDVKITAHVWVDSKASWYDIRDDLPRYPEGFGNPKPSGS